MPSYFFHIENGNRISADTTAEFPDDLSAFRDAETIADELSRNQLGPTGLRVIVNDHAGRPVGNVPLLFRR
jgi:hypothetical protein